MQLSHGVLSVSYRILAWTICYRNVRNYHSVTAMKYLKLNGRTPKSGCSAPAEAPEWSRAQLCWRAVINYNVDIYFLTVELQSTRGYLRSIGFLPTHNGISFGQLKINSLKRKRYLWAWLAGMTAKPIMQSHINDECLHSRLSLRDDVLWQYRRGILYRLTWYWRCLLVGIDIRPTCVKNSLKTERA